MLLALGPSLLVLINGPPLLEKLVLNLLERDPPRLAPNAAEDPVRVQAERVVEAALLASSLESGRGDLLDVDVRHGVRRGVGGFGGGLELFDFEGDGGEGDGFAEEEGDALEGEAGLDTIGEGVVHEPTALEVADVAGSWGSHGE